MNNYDQSSTGVNLNLSCFYDTGLSSILFDENIERLQYGKDQYKGDLFQYTDYGQIGTIDLADFDNYIIPTKSDLVSILLNTETMEYLQEYSSNYFYKPFSRLTKPELLEFYLNYFDTEFLIDILQESFTPKYSIVSIRGYCQGDYAEIVIPDQYWAMIGAEKTEQALNNLAEYMHNLFYNAPIHCRLSVDGEECCSDEFIQSEYHWDRDEIIIGFCAELNWHEQWSYIKNWLENNLPEYPNYE